jgi:transposase
VISAPRVRICGVQPCQTVGFDLTERVREACLAVPEDAWVPALEGCGDLCDGAWMAKLDIQLPARPEGTRAICRRERPHPGAQLTLTDADGHRFQVLLTNQMVSRIARLEQVHRSRAACYPCRLSSPPSKEDVWPTPPQRSFSPPRRAAHWRRTCALQRPSSASPSAAASSSWPPRVSAPMPSPRSCRSAPPRSASGACASRGGGLEGLSDAPRSGAPGIYTDETERRILAQLDEPLPGGETVWTARLLARELGDVSEDHIWRVFRKHGIHLQRRRSWCVSTDPEFAAKAADIVGLYLAPPENALVISVDEKPSIQATERAQGYLRFSDGQTYRGFSDRCKRHGTTTLFAALEVASGLVTTGHYKRRRRIEFLDFMNQLIRQYPADQEIHVVLDNLSTHSKKGGTWLVRHPNVHFHFTPTGASWLNQIEVWFSILTVRVLRNGSFTSPRELRASSTASRAPGLRTAAPSPGRRRRSTR